MTTPRNQALSGVVLGMEALTGEVKARVDIDVFLTQHPDTFNLMLHAISQMQKDPKKLGFYALAGKVNFPGIGGNPDTTQTSFPYNFRLPGIFSVKTVTIHTAPDDVPNANFDNPLYSYKFSEKTGQLPKDDRDANADMYSPKQIVRHPTSLTTDTHNLKAQSNVLSSGREGRTTLAMKLINSKPYQLLSTVASDMLQRGDLTNAPGLVQANVNNPRGNGSLEGSVHGKYHLLIGGTTILAGHMSDPIVAAFDPVFWFHHAKDLLPFYKTRSGPGSGTYHNSNDAKTTEAYEYFYDDFECNPNATTLWNKFTAQYEWSTRTPQHPQFTDPPKSMVPLDVQATQFSQKSLKPINPVVKAAGFLTSGVSAEAGPIASQAQALIQKVSPAMRQATPAKINAKFDREWYVDSSELRSASNGAFTIFFFLAKVGELVENIASFAESPFLAGLNHISS
ncbi:hypothetical protein CC86DRAFT_427058 [Ophiobolus disseminans]|uniref:Tyrosinase copper-binding domain-containing protein n=1 Tax=Ophiobolus disseminans TaxID=1469910 RepID=A0A6A6ZJV5_9PLEO|nr:hypothetical protein CC86DRAFT_427058 [Ophiobolus disseminans]